MKVNIKRVDGTTVDVDGTQEECLAAIHAICGYSPLQWQPIVVQPQVLPLPTTNVFTNDFDKGTMVVTKVGHGG